MPSPHSHTLVLYTTKKYSSHLSPMSLFWPLAFIAGAILALPSHLDCIQLTPRRYFTSISNTEQGLRCWNGVCPPPPITSATTLRATWQQSGRLGCFSMPKAFRYRKNHQGVPRNTAIEINPEYPKPATERRACCHDKRKEFSVPQKTLWTHLTMAYLP